LGIFSPEVCSVNMQLALHLQDKVLIRNEPILIKNTREDLNWEHLEQSLVVSSNFNEYLMRMQGHTDDQRMRDIGLR